MTGQELVKLEEQFEVFKQTCIHPALFWSGKMADMVRTISYLTFNEGFGEGFEKLIYYESRYTDEIIKRCK